MGLNTFNKGVVSTATSPLSIYKMKVVPVTTKTNRDASVNTAPFFRAGATTSAFNLTNSGISIYINGATTSITYTTYLASAVHNAITMVSADSCMYILINNGSTRQLIKVADTTGVVTAIGSSFTPTTSANWNLPTMKLDTVSGHLKFVSNGFYHLVNKTTGAIVSQDTAISFGSYDKSNVRYVTQDGTVGLTSVSNSTTGGLANFPQMVHQTYGLLPVSRFQPQFNPNLEYQSSGANLLLRADDYFHVDSDKMYLCPYNIVDINPRIVSLDDFDKYIKSVAELNAGVS